MAPLQFLLIRLSALRDQRSHVLTGKSPAGVSQIEEEDIVSLIDRLCVSKCAPDRLEMLPHRGKRENQQKLRGLPQADELANPPQRPASQARPDPAALCDARRQTTDHGFGFCLA